MASISCELTLTPNTSMPPATVAAYKQLANVELEVRPLHHRRPSLVRANVRLCMPAYHLEWHMRQALRPILFEDHDKSNAQAARTSIVAKAERSAAADRKAATKRTDDGFTVHSFRSLLADLATLTRNIVAIQSDLENSFVLYADPHLSSSAPSYSSMSRQNVASSVPPQSSN